MAKDNKNDAHRQRICCFTVNLRRYTIKQQISTCLISVSFIILLSLCLVSIVSIIDLGNRTSAGAMDNLRQQIETNARNFSIVNANEIGGTLQRRAAAANIIAYALSDFYFANELTYDKETPSYYDENVRPGSTPGAKFEKNNNNFAIYKSKEHSSYYIPKSTNYTVGSAGYTRLNKCRVPSDPLKQFGTPMDVDGCNGLATLLSSDATLRKQIQRSVQIERYFKDFSEKITDIYSIYFGFDSSGLFRQYPGTNSNSDGDTPRTYDPRKRPWYRDALTAIKYTSGTKQHVFGKTIITEPYQDFWSKVWMVTVAKAIYDKNYNIIGVLGIDISIKNIQDEIIKVHFLETGYVILCESISRDPKNKPDERIVVSAPNFENRVKDGKVVFADVLPLVAKNRTMFDKVWTNTDVIYYETEKRSASSTGSSEGTTSDNKKYLLAYSSASSNMFRERYTIFIVIPEDEALAVVPVLEKKIVETETEVVSIVSATSIITAITTILIVFWVTNTISRPVQAMVRIANSIVKGAAEQNLVKDFASQERSMSEVRDYAGIQEGFQNADVGRKHIDNEMQLLARSFLTMVSGLKRDANREKARVIHPLNPYHAEQENEFIGEFMDQKLL